MTRINIEGERKSRKEELVKRSRESKLFQEIKSGKKTEQKQKDPEPVITSSENISLEFIASRSFTHDITTIEAYPGLNESFAINGWRKNTITMLKALPDKSIREVFEQEVQATPDEIAFANYGESITISAGDHIYSLARIPLKVIGTTFEGENSKGITCLDEKGDYLATIYKGPQGRNGIVDVMKVLRNKRKEIDLT